MIRTREGDTVSGKRGDRPKRPPGADIRKAVRVVTDILGPRSTPKMSAALGRALAETSPRSDHGRLLAQTIQAVKAGAVPADADMRRVRRLAQGGNVPTAAAVRGLAESERIAAEADAQRQAVVQAAARRDGPAAAERVAAVVASTGDGPTWAELAVAMGWPRSRMVTALIVQSLHKAGWLKTGEAARSVRPGPRAGGPVTRPVKTPQPGRGGNGKPRALPGRWAS